jgi:adenylate kinase
LINDLTYPIDAVLLLGPTGVGKSPLGDRLSLSGFLGRKAHHLDFGHALRSAVTATAPSLYSPEEQLFIQGVLKQGLLLENEHFPLARKIISHVLHSFGFRQRDLLILNGIPRHVGQARDMSTIATIHALVVLDCSADAVYCRLRDNIGGDRGVRHDDGVALVRKKLSLFHERTQPLIDHFENHGSRVYRLAVSERTTVDEVSMLLSSLAASDPPVTLVTEPPQR